MPARNRMWAGQRAAIRRARSLRAGLSLRAIAAALAAADGIRLSHEGVKKYYVALQTTHFEVQRCTTTPWDRLVADSALEEAGFELFVPLRLRASPSWWNSARKLHGAPGEVSPSRDL